MWYQSQCDSATCNDSHQLHKSDSGLHSNHALSTQRILAVQEDVVSRGRVSLANTSNSLAVVMQMVHVKVVGAVAAGRLLLPLVASILTVLEARRQPDEEGQDTQSSNPDEHVQQWDAELVGAV